MIALSLCLCLTGLPAMASPASESLTAGSQPASNLAPGGSPAQAATNLQDGKDEGPSPEKVAVLVERLEAAWKGKDPDLAKQLDALRAAIDVPHADVVKALEKGLTSKQDEVQRAAIETLGRMDHGAALERLLSFAKKSRKDLAKNPELNVLVIKSVGRHGDLRALDYLTDKLFQSRTAPEIKARIVSVAMIRDRSAVQALFDEIKSTDRRRIQNLMPAFQLALAQLAGRDEGLAQDRWVAWWRGVDKKWQVSPEPAPLPKELQRRWDAFWGNMRKYERNTDRQNRGQDPEDDGDADKGGRRKRGEGDGR